MQAIHNQEILPFSTFRSCFKEQRYKINASNSQRGQTWFNFDWKLFQRAKIQDKCKQFTTAQRRTVNKLKLFQRAKIQDKCKQFTTDYESTKPNHRLFQRAKIQDKCKQFTTLFTRMVNSRSCFKEQRYKINASNSQQRKGER